MEIKYYDNKFEKTLNDYEELEKVKKDLERIMKSKETDDEEEFEIKFYTQNLVNGYKIEQKAIKNLKQNYNEEILKRIKNYDEIGIVEAVADDRYHIQDDMIIAD